MTLFIACLLIYHYDMEWYWYLVAILLWASHMGLLLYKGRSVKALIH